MKKYSLALVAVLALAIAPACGGGGDDDAVDAADFDGNGNLADAPPTIDASDIVDSGGGGAVLGLGEVCTGQATDCQNGNASTCVALSASATHGFCSASCGSSDSTSTPPTGGDAICTGEWQGSTPAQGTAACALYQGTAAPYQWSCAVLCGTSGSTDLGGCPDGLVCGADIANVCS